MQTVPYRRVKSILQKTMLFILLLACLPARAQSQTPESAGQRKLDSSNRYASGQVMSSIMAAKEKTWARYEAAGYFAPGRWLSGNEFSPCAAGTAVVAGISYRCRNLDVTGHLSHTDLGTTYKANTGYLPSPAQEE